MQVDARQYQQIVSLAFGDIITAGGDVSDPYRELYSTAALPAPDAELIIAIAQLAVAADRVDDRDERALFHALAEHVYGHAKLQTTVPELGPAEDDDARLDHMRSHAAQLVGKPSAALAFAVAYVLTISDLELAPEESEMLSDLGEALGLSLERMDDLSAGVAAAITPAEE